MNQITSQLFARNNCWQAAVLVGLLLCCATGCQGLFQRESISGLNLLQPGTENTASIDDVQGPMQRVLQTSHNENSVTKGNSKGVEQFMAAKRLFDQGEFVNAEHAFNKIAKEHRLDDSGFIRKRRWKDAFKTRRQLQAHYSDSPLREDALFMLAESRYKQEKLPGAETAYLQLLEEYPNTRHMDVSTQKLFDIAMTWMNFKVAKASDVELAAYSDDGPSSKPKLVKNKEYKRPSFFNFSSKKRPSTDTEGRALEALKAIWLNDPTGKLADDALMFTASHYLRVGRYEEASETYRLLREEFPQSPHAKDAYVLGAYVSQASYQGAAYDGKNLTESRQLQLMAGTLYPNMSAEEKQRLQQGLQKLDDAVVARDFSRAIFWLRKGKFEAVEMTCHHIINTYPDSKYADKARGLLAKLPEYRTKNPLRLALDGVNADSIQPISKLPTQPLIEPPRPEISPPSENNGEKAPQKLPRFRLPKLKPIPVPNLLPSWSKEAEPQFVPDPLPESPGDENSQPGRVNLTLGEE